MISSFCFGIQIFVILSVDLPNLKIKHAKLSTMIHINNLLPDLIIVDVRAFVIVTVRAIVIVAPRAFINSVDDTFNVTHIDNLLLRCTSSNRPNLR